MIKIAEREEKLLAKEGLTDLGDQVFDKMNSLNALHPFSREEDQARTYFAGDEAYSCVILGVWDTDMGQ